MKILRVGVRVRTTGCLNPDMRHLVGHEGVIVGPSNGNPGCWRVEIPGFGINDATGWPCGWHEDRLEPIQPSGAAPSELSYTELMDRCKAGEVECV